MSIKYALDLGCILKEINIFKYIEYNFTLNFESTRFMTSNAVLLIQTI